MADTIPNMSAVKIIRAKQLAQELGVHLSTLYNWINPTSKYYREDFPKRINLGGRSRGWYLVQIKQWLDQNQIH